MQSTTITIALNFLYYQNYYIFLVIITITITPQSIIITITKQICYHFQSDNKLHWYVIFSIYIL